MSLAVAPTVPGRPAPLARGVPRARPRAPPASPRPRARLLPGARAPGGWSPRRLPHSRPRAVALREWTDLTTAEFDALDAEACVALLPVGAIEQHGPHLPVCVDAAINAGVLNRAFELLREDDDASASSSESPAAPDGARAPVSSPDTTFLRLPPVPYGKSVEHDDFAGTISLSASTLTAVWTDIGESVARAGVRKLVLFNSHGGQPQIADVVARDLRKRLGMLVVTCDWFSFGLPEGLFSETELKHGLHGGDVETSVMLHLHPRLVNMARAENFRSAGERMEATFEHLTPEGGVGFGWLAQDLNPSGATGDAANATREKGEMCVEYAAGKLVELMREVAAFDSECAFNRGDPGRYCQVNLRRVWDQPMARNGGGGGEEGEARAEKSSKYKSHYAG